MILCKNYIAQSSIEGLGLFAVEDIPAGSTIWQDAPGLDIALSKDDYAKLPDLAREYIRHYGYLDRATQTWKLSYDNDRFFNHSEDPNVMDQGEYVVSKRDIAAGEEITCDYREFDDDWEWKLGIQR